MHLSTSIVLMFVAGGLVWANCPKTHKWDKVQADFSQPDSFVRILPLTVEFQPQNADAFTAQINMYYCGCPIDCYEIFVTEPVGASYFSVNAEINSTKFHLLPAALDALIALATLITVGFVCEWWIQRNRAQS